MLTYLGMTMPMAVIALVTWFCHPFRGNRAEVAVSRVGFKELIFMLGLTAAVTAAFWFILDFFNTAQLALSTVSVATSFAAAYLTFRRSPYFALAYAMNDVVLIALWAIASRADISCISVIVCFLAFLANDIYGFVSWKRMEKKQGALVRKAQ
jgi:nicotinamide riboside transporter PnuC